MRLAIPNPLAPADLDESRLPLSRQLTLVAPGLALCAAIAGLAFALGDLPVLRSLSPVLLAVTLGMALRNTVGLAPVFSAGARFSLRHILRWAIVLLGMQLTLGQLTAVGWSGAAVIVASLIATFCFTVFVGRVLGVPPGLATLIGVGTAVCGASAVAAANSVLDTSDEDASYAVASVTLLGTIAMFAYPVLASALDLGPQDYGLWIGASVQETGQVIAAAFQGGQTAGEYGVLVKLSRVLLLAPMIVLLAWIAQPQRAEGQVRVPIPWFVAGFGLVIVINTLVAPSVEVRAWAMTATVTLLSIALAGLGLETDARKLRAQGVAPFVLAGASAIFIGAFSLALVLVSAWVVDGREPAPSSKRVPVAIETNGRGQVVRPAGQELPAEPVWPARGGNMLDLYTWNTHSGHIGRIAIEESGLPYNLHPVNLQAGANREAAYAAMSGHRRIPLLVDSEGPGGQPITLIESAVIQVYLAKKSGNPMYPSGLREQLEVDQWLLHGQATFGPGIGPHRNMLVNVRGENAGAREFFRLRAERLYETLDLRLEGRRYIATDRFTVADTAHFVTVLSHEEQQIDLERFANVKRWYETIAARPAVRKGIERVG